nr:hypothetical protein [Tanacetum cinerariifolium]
MGRDTVKLETAVSTISQEYLLEFTSEYGTLDDLHPKLPGPEERIVDFPEGKVDMDLFNLIRAPNPTKVKTGTRPRAAHEVPLLTITASRVIEMEDPATATDSSGVPSIIERSPLDFANENPSQQSTVGNKTKDQGPKAVAPEVPPPKNVTTTRVAPEARLAKEIDAMGPCVIKEHRKRGNDGVDTNAPPKLLRRDHADSRPTQSTVGGKSLAAIGLGMGSTFPVPTSQDTHVDVSDPNPLSFVNPQSIPTENVAQYANISYSFVLNSDLPRERSLQEIQNRRIPPLPSWSGHPKAFISRSEQYNINLARQVAMGSQLWLRFEQQAKLLKKSIAQVARRDQRIQARENEIKKLDALLEAETDMKKTTDAKNGELGKELKNLRAMFSDLQLSNDRLSQQRCVEIDAHLDALSINFDEELYPHMLTAIAGRRWVIGHELCLAVIKCEHEKANLDLKAIEAYDLEADTKYVAALHALRDLKYPVVDLLESLKDASIDIHVYPEVRDPKDPWAFKEEILLVDAIAANVSRAEKKKKCRVVCGTHGVGSAHHARSDGVPVSVLTVALQALAILLTDAATQTEKSEDEASPRICTGSVSCALWESSRMHLTS